MGYVMVILILQFGESYNDAKLTVAMPLSSHYQAIIELFILQAWVSSWNPQI